MGNHQGDGRSEFACTKLDHERDKDAEAVALSLVARMIKESKTEFPRKVHGTSAAKIFDWHFLRCKRSV